MSVTEIFEEFIVCRDKVGLIDSLKSKIERLFGTRVYFNEVSQDGDKQKRWVRVTGGKWDRINAKTYILGVSDPEETKTVQCSADFIDNEVLEDIEKNTQAVLSKPSSNVVKISGNELAVTLALSSLEELTGSSQEVVTDSASDTDIGVEKTRERSATQRLDEKLHETFGDKSESLQRYPADVKRVFLECGKYHSEDLVEDISDDQLHGLGATAASSQNSRKTSSEVIVRAKEENDPRKHYTAPVYRVNLPDMTVSDGIGVSVADGVSDNKNSEGVSTVTDKFPAAAQITPVKQQTGRLGRGANAESLRDFARNVGYTDDEIDEGFLYVQPPMKPTEFLEVLKNVKENKQRLGLDDNSSSGSKSDRQKTSGGSDINIVHSDDDDIMIVEEHFKNPVQNKKPLSPKNKQGGLSKKEKKKNEQKQKDLAKEFQQQQSSGGKKKQPSPQNVSTSGTKRKSDPDSDHEQTCVMKIWEPASELPDRVPHLPPRQQRIVGPTPPISEANPPPPHPVPRYRPGPPNHSPQHHVVPNSSNSAVHAPRQAKPGQRNELRYIIIDGSNVAMFHGNGKVFSCKGIQIAVDYFLDRGHKVTVFVPEWRKYRNYHDNKIRDQEILLKLEESENLVFTPSRKIQGKLVASYDDRFILTLAEKEDSIILSNDQYRDLMREKVSWKKIVEERLLMYRFVGDHFMPAEDPLGRNGPMLDDFLRKNPLTSPPVPDRVPLQQQQLGILGPRPVMSNIPHQAVPTIGYWQTDGQAAQPFLNQGFQNGGLGQWQMRGQAPQQLGNQGYHNGGQGQVQWQPRMDQPRPRQLNPPKTDLPKRHADVTEQLLKQLKIVFPESSQEEKLRRVLENHSSETDLNRLTNYCMEVIFK